MKETTTTEMQYLFINYRKSDVKYIAGRLKDALDRELEPGQVFIDYKGIGAGTAWAEEIRTALGKTSMLFALIGAGWLKAHDQNSGIRRLDIADDWVRTEIEHVLDTENSAELLPVLVNESELPKTEYLPESIQALTDTQGIRLRHTEWEADLAKILLILREAEFRFRPRPQPRDVLSTYRRHLRTTHAQLVPFFPEAHNKLLEDVYVELSLSRDSELCKTSFDSEQRLLMGERSSLRLRDLLDIPLSANREADHAITGRWIIRGDPGSGKSTIARHLCWELAGELYSAIPVFISLPAWAGDQRSPFEIAEEELGGDFAPKTLSTALEEKAKQDNKLWLIFDGLDEVAPNVLPKVRTRLKQLCSDYEMARIVVMSRRIGMISPGPEFRPADLLPLGHKARQKLLTNWLGSSRAETLQTQFVEHPRLEQMMSSPLQLTLLANVAIESWDRNGQNRSLPTNRRELYDQAIDILLRRGHGEKPTSVKNPPDARYILSELSLALQESNTSNWTEGELNQSLWAARKVAPDIEDQMKLWGGDHSVYLKDIGEHSGVLAQHDGPKARWAFLHRQFREFLAAEALQRRTHEDWIERVAKIKDDDLQRWAETMAFACSMSDDPLAALTPLREHDSKLALETLPELEGVTPEAMLEFLTSTDGWDGLALNEVVSNWDIHSEAGRDRAAKLLWSMVGPRPVEELGYLHFVLTQIGCCPDRREFFEQAGRPLDSVPELSFVDVPRNVFLMGSPENEFGHSDSEGPQRAVTIESFQLATTTVTNAQYLQFDRDHEIEEWEGKGVSPDELANHPVVNVSWWQAYAFAAWIEAKLPSEAEWEYACRGGTMTPFSFGAKLTTDEANYNGNYPYEDGPKGDYLERTVEVGSLPANKYGLREMHGNVWEWCQDTWHDNYEGAPVTNDAWEDSGSVNRVVRGGSWINDARYCRSAYRSRDQPGFRLDELGFRLARSSPNNLTTSPPKSESAN